MNQLGNWRRHFLAAIALAALVGQLAQAKPNCEFFLNNPTLIEALHKAVTDDYRVEIFAKQVNGKTKLLVLMGELHIKTPTSAVVGRNVVNQFDYVGIEGFDPQKTWGGKLSANVIDPIIEKIGIKRTPQFWLARVLGRFYGTNGRTEGSTITEAVAAEMRAGFLNDIQKKSPDELKELIATLETILEESSDTDLEIEGVKILSARELLAMANSVLTGRSPEQIAEHTGPKETVDLEKNHVPDFAENWYSIDSYVSWGILAAYCAMVPFVPDNYQIGAAVGATAYVFYGLTGSVLGNTRYKATKWYQRYFPLSLALVTGRNATMARNIMETLESRPEVSELLAIVGKGHVDGMKQLLEQAGYKPLSIPTASQMSAQDARDNVTP